MKIQATGECPARTERSVSVLVGSVSGLARR
jgi:hypothetical protein